MIESLDIEIREVTSDPEAFLDAVVQPLGYTRRVGAEGQNTVLYELLEGGWVRYQWKVINQFDHTYGDGGKVFIERRLMKDGRSLLVSRYNESYDTLSDDSEDYSHGAHTKTELLCDDALALALFEAIKAKSPSQVTESLQHKS